MLSQKEAHLTHCTLKRYLVVKDKLGQGNNVTRGIWVFVLLLLFCVGDRNFDGINYLNVGVSSGKSGYYTV